MFIYVKLLTIHFDQFKAANVTLASIIKNERGRLSHLIARLNQPEGRLRGKVSGHDGVRGAALDLVVLGAADDDSVRHHRDEAVDVSAKVNLHHVAVL